MDGFQRQRLTFAFEIQGVKVIMADRALSTALIDGETFYAADEGPDEYYQGPQYSIPIDISVRPVLMRQCLNITTIYIVYILRISSEFDCNTFIQN